jgi:hypothetical protein
MCCRKFISKQKTTKRVAKLRRVLYKFVLYTGAGNSCAVIDIGGLVRFFFLLGGAAGVADGYELLSNERSSSNQKSINILTLGELTGIVSLYRAAIDNASTAGSLGGDLVTKP